MRTVGHALLVVLCSLLGTAAGNTQDLQPDANYMIAQSVPRFALAIGVENYEDLELVPNALNDLDAAVRAFHAAGFGTVMSEPNATGERLRTALRQLSQLTTDTGRPAVVAIFFAGHGFQSGASNYIVPRDAKRASLVQDSIAVPNILSRLTRSSGVTFVFLDACRTLTPLVKAERPGEVDIPAQPGFGQAANFAGTIQIFAAKWGQAAVSRAHQDDHNSPYSEALKQFLNKRGDSISTTYGRVSRFVKGKTNPEQEPEILTVSSIDTIRFMPLSTAPEFEAEDRHWRATLATGRAKCVKDFKNAFPDSRYTVAALRWLAENPSAVNTPGGDECPER